MKKLTVALIATGALIIAAGALIFSVYSNGPNDSLDITASKKHLKDIREQHSNSSYETSLALKQLAAAYSRRGHTSESEILLQLVVVIDRDVRQQGQLEYDIELEEELTRHYSKMVEAYKKGDFKSHYEHSAHLLLYSRRVAINDLSRHHSLLVKAINRDGVAPYLSWIIDYAYRLAKFNSAGAKSKFSQLAKLYYEQNGKHEPSKSGKGVPVLVRSENGYRLYSRNIAEATTKLLFSKIGENEFLYGSIPRDFSKLAVLVEQCNELMNKSEDVVRDEKICEELTKYYEDNRSKDSGPGGDVLSGFRAGGVDIGRCLIDEINAQRDMESPINVVENYQSCKVAQQKAADERRDDPFDRGMDRYTKGKQSYADLFGEQLEKNGYKKTDSDNRPDEVGTSISGETYTRENSAGNNDYATVTEELTSEGTKTTQTKFDEDLNFQEETVITELDNGVVIEKTTRNNGDGTSTVTEIWVAPDGSTSTTTKIINNDGEEDSSGSGSTPTTTPDPSDPLSGVDPCMDELFLDADRDAGDDRIGVGFGALDPWINPGPDGAPVGPIPGAERLGACYQQYDAEEASNCAALILCVDGIDEDCNCVTDVEPFVIRGAPACSNITCPEGTTCDGGSGFCKAPSDDSGPPVLIPGTGPLPRPGGQ